MKKSVILTIIIIIILLVGASFVYLSAFNVGEGESGLFSRKPGGGKKPGGGRCVSNELECGDCIDNDGDGLIDYKINKRGKVMGDPECSSITDDSEASCIPSTEICNNLDDDCNNQIDEGVTQQCGISNVGECQYGTKTCSAGVWGSCIGDINPTNETCDGSKDEDCDSVVDDGCDCINGQTKSCGSNVGECVSGNQTCAGGSWGACIGEISPSTEVCDSKDNNCNGLIDEFGACVNQTQTCTDSDGGVVYNITGTISGFNVTTGSYYNNTDYCFGTGQKWLKEYYCSGNIATFTIISNCSGVGNYTQCSSGRCI